jgi:hypothetical protein
MDIPRVLTGVYATEACISGLGSSIHKMWNINSWAEPGSASRPTNATPFEYCWPEPSPGQGIAPRSGPLGSRC